MDITMYDVNFGDCVLYQNNGKSLLIDCGAKFEGKGLQAHERVKEGLEGTKQKNRSLLITHFDEDHYNGVIAMPEGFRFDKIYLPLYTLYGGSLCSTEDLFRDVVTVWTYLVSLGKDKKIKQLHRLFIKLPKLVDSVADIICVCSEDRIPLGCYDINVLWPRRVLELKSKMHSTSLKEILRRNCNASEKGTFEDFIDCADDYVDGLIDLYQLLRTKDFNWDEVYREQVDSNLDLRPLDRAYAKKLETLDCLYKDLERIGERLKGHIYLEPMEKKRVANVEVQKIKDMNESSVIIVVEEYLVAFADATKRIIKKLNKEGNLKGFYPVIKAPHHGTKTHWSKAMPEAELMLISNSGINRSDWGIYHRYAEECDVQCTNTYGERCERYMSGRPCRGCNVGRKIEKVIVRL